MTKKLPKLTLSYDKKEKDWKLKEDKTKEVIKTFESKGKATKGGALEKALGEDGGSVKIKKKDGTIGEERTYPGSADPASSEG